MKHFLKTNWKFLLLVLLGGLIGGWCYGLYSYDSLSEEMLQQLNENNISRQIVALSSMYQYGVLFGVILAAVGIVISKKTGLWKSFVFDKKAAVATAVIAVIGGLLLYPGDMLIFGAMNSWVKAQYAAAPTLNKILGGLLVGGIIEEEMMRLFFMSLLVLIFAKLFHKGQAEIPVRTYICANIISALLFAAGHLPSTMTMTALTPVIIIRCFLLNGGLGLCFGYLYRKHGIGYAMIAHGLCHFISDMLMLIFV